MSGDQSKAAFAAKMAEASEAAAALPKPEPVSAKQFDDKLAQLAMSIIEQALKFKGPQRFTERLEAFKAATVYKGMLNKAGPTDPIGSGIAALQEGLLEEAPQGAGDDARGNGADDEEC